MEITELRDFAELSARYAADWQRIAALSADATIFQTPEWTTTCWKHFGRGRRLRAFVFHEGESVVGVAICFLPASFTPLRPLRFVGEGVSDYLDLIALPGFEQSVAEAFGQRLRGGGGWDAADFAQSRPASLARQIPGVTILTGEACPYLPLPDDWEMFRRSLSKKLRQNLGYYERALGKQGEIQFRTATEDTLSSDLSTFFALHQERWRRRWMPGMFASSAMQHFHEDAAPALLRAGMLRLHTLSLNGQICAALYCFQKGAICYYYLGGFAAGWTRYSVGTILTAYAIRHAIERDNATEFDFLRGNEGYKYKWGAKDRFNARLILPQAGGRGAILSSFAAATLRAELRLKEGMHRRHGGAGASQETTETKNG